MLIAGLKNEKVDEFKIKCLKLSHQNSTLMKLLGRKKKKKKVFFMNVLDRKMPARDKGSTKKKRQTSQDDAKNAEWSALAKGQSSYRAFAYKMAGDWIQICHLQY